MKKLFITIIALLPFMTVSPAMANVIDEVQAAIKNGDFAQINVIAAKNPTDQGDIAMYLLEQSQNTTLSQVTRIKIFDAVTPFGSQIPLGDAGEAASIIAAMLGLANDPGFQKSHPHESADIFATALSLSGQPNILTANPNLHDLTLADADDFTSNNPGEVDKRLKDEVDLALQIGLPPPLGPRGLIDPGLPKGFHGVTNPSPE